MKVLFVCRANIGRSQTAAGLYNMIHPAQATSAGTKVEPIGQKLSDRPGAANAIIAMKEKGLDMSGNTTTQVTEKMLDNYDKVVVMAEPTNIPSWLEASPKFEYWDVADMKGQDLNTTRKLGDQIQKLIQERL